jgi:L-iditol 2-dehydrogenase
VSVGRVAELIGQRQFRLVEYPAPEPGPGEIQVRVQAVGICGSDMHAYSEGGVGDTPCVYPMVLGHEPAGVVVETGAGVTGWQRGDTAAFEPAIYCYHCEYCLSGRHNVCAHLRFLSSPGDPGFFREYVNLPAANLLALPANLGVNEGSLIEPLAVALHSMTIGQPKLGETAVVFGAGPIGLLTIASLKLSGAGRVWAVEPVDARRELAIVMGADAALDPAALDIPRQVLSDTAGRGVDLVFDCATKGESSRQAIQVARRAGRVVFTGIPSERETLIEFHTWRRKELALFQVRRSNHESVLARKILSADPGRFAPLITHTRTFGEISRAFAQLERYQEGVGKLIVRVDS